MALTNQGQTLMLNAFYAAASVGATLYMGLATNGVGTLGKTSTLTDITEVTGGSYARLAITRNATNFPAPALASSDEQTTSPTETMAAPTANWGTPNYVFLCDVSSGTAGNLIEYFAIPTPIAINNGDPAPSYKLQIKQI